MVVSLLSPIASGPQRPAAEDHRFAYPMVRPVARRVDARAW
jgi:hypothetical protein